MTVRFKDYMTTLCLVTGFLALLSYIVVFGVAWGFYDQGYPNGTPVRNAALVSTIPAFFIVLMCLTFILTICCQDFWTECCPNLVNDRSSSSPAGFLLALLSPLFMVLAGVFALVGGAMFAVVGATFVPSEDITNLFEVHLFGAVASVFGILTGLCCCCGSVFCCCALRGEQLQGEITHLQDRRLRLKVHHVESSV